MSLKSTHFSHSFRRSIFSIALLLSFAGLTSCAPGEKEFKPVVAMIQSQQAGKGDIARAISAEEAKEICKTTKCEPNQIYYADFGSGLFGRRPRPAPPPSQPVTEPTPTQPPVATPTPSPTLPPGVTPTKTPTPTPTPAQGSEILDYSRGIMNMNGAWNISEGREEVIVAVIDSGADYTHPDLKDNIAVNLAEKNGQPGVDDDGNGYVDDVYGWDFYNNKPNAFDDNGHGTHCSGIIAAERNGFGVRGVAPKVKILPVKFLGANGSGDTSAAINAINYAVSRGARVLSNSWGGGGFSDLLNVAIQTARGKGVFVVAAAGNDGKNNDVTPSYPANYTGVVSVGSSDQSDLKSSFSNYGASSVRIFAPGSSILSTYPGNQYKTLSGTSMATPQISGALALGVSVYSQLTESQMISDMCSSATKILTSYSKCGRMDVEEFLRKVSLH